MEDLIKISTVKYKWKTRLSLPYDDPIKIMNTLDCVRELDVLFPELIYNETSTLHVNYAEIIPICINAMKDLKTLNDNLQTTVKL